MYFKSILVFTAIIFWNNLLNSQITKVDSQWYVLNYEGRSFGSVGTTGQYPYLNQMVDGNSVVKIIGTSTPSTYLPCLAPTPPANPNPCVLNIPRNDLFIIYKDGSYYNSIDLATPLPWTSPEFNFNSTKKIAYLYFSNIYEEDDPPQSIRVENQSSGISNDLPAHTPPNNIMTTNHDIVRGKDLTLIIPHQIPISCASINLHISNALNDAGTPVLISGNQVPILKLNKVFDNNWSYHLNAGTPLNNLNNYVSQINNITFPSGIKYHFFNFNADFENDPNLIGKTVKIEAYCSANPAVPIATLTTAISDIHDPNYIEVKCIYKKKKPWYCPFSQDRYFVKYFVQFMNDGDMPVNSVIVNFNLPDIAIPSTFRVGNWKYGDSSGCRFSPTGILNYTIPTSHSVSVSLGVNPASVLLEQISDDLSVHNPNQYGSFEFCVEVNRDPTLFNYVSLQPESPTTNFDGVVYPIQHFKDPYYTDKALVEGVFVTLKKRKIVANSSSCNCNCTP